MRHQDLQLNHIIESWVYPNSATRVAASGFVSTDVGRIAYQTDAAQYWRLLTVAPTWGAIDPGEVTSQSAPANPTGTGSTTGVMMGLAGSITPIQSGKVVVIITGTIANNTASDGAKPQIRFGTGGAPANAAALIGTAVGNTPQQINNANTAALRTSFTCIAIISGLLLGTPYWLDLSLAAITGGTANVFDIAIATMEV